MESSGGEELLRQLPSSYQTCEAEISLGGLFHLLGSLTAAYHYL